MRLNKLLVTIILMPALLSFFFPHNTAYSMESQNILVSPQKIAEIVSNIKSMKEPWLTWYKAAKARADAGLKFTSKTTYYDEYKRSQYAMDLALAYMVTEDDRYLAKAKEFVSEAGLNNVINYRDSSSIWCWGYILQGYALTYGWIRNTLTDVEDAAICQRLYSVTKDIFIYQTTVWKALVNTYFILFSGIGTVSMVLDGYLDSEDWLVYVVNDFFGDSIGPGDYMNSYLSPGGSFNENLYQNDVFGAALPFLLLLKEKYGRDYINGCAEQDPWPSEDGRIAKMFANNAAMMMPDGNICPWDTGFRAPAGYLNIAAGAIPDPKNIMWLWDRTGRTCWTPALLSMALYDKAADDAKEPPKYTSRILDNGAVFRTGWTADDTYFLLNAENYPVYSYHENPDQTSFVLYAKGQYLLIDPGDGRNYDYSYPNGTPDAGTRLKHHWIRLNPTAHNLVLVDNGGDFTATDTNYNDIMKLATPAVNYSYTNPTDPAYVTDQFLSGSVDLASVEMSYSNKPDVSITRTAIFPYKKYIVIADKLKANTEHEYHFLLHFGGPSPRDTSSGSGVISGTLTVSESGKDIQWQTKNGAGKNVYLNCYLSPESVSTGRYLGPTNYYSGKIFDHHYTKSTILAEDAISIMALYPRLEDEAPPVCGTIDTENGECISVSTAGSGVNIHAFADDPSSDVTNKLISFRGNGAWLNYFTMPSDWGEIFIWNGTRLKISGKDVLSISNGKATMSITKINPKLWEIEESHEGGTRQISINIKNASGFLVPKVIELNIDGVQISRYQYSNYNLRFDLNEPPQGSVHKIRITLDDIRVGAPPVYVPPGRQPEQSPGSNIPSVIVKQPEQIAPKSIVSIPAPMAPKAATFNATSPSGMKPLNSPAISIKKQY